MNFLAHAHLASETQSSITGNLLGDFTKGIKLIELNHQWRIGVKLHRKIDVYTDSHEAIKTCRIELGSLRRYGGIIVDIIADHVIAKYFSQLSQVTLTQFSQQVYLELSKNYDLLPEQFKSVSKRMIAANWLESYQYLPQVEQALHRTAGRLSNQPPLEQGLAWYQANTAVIDQRILAFYQELIRYSHGQFRQLRIEY